MSKIDESSWVTLTITLTPDDMLEIQDAIAELQWGSGMRSGILDHIANQYEMVKAQAND